MYCMGLSGINSCYRIEDEGRISFLSTCRQVYSSYHDHIEDARFVLVNVSDDDMNHGIDYLHNVYIVGTYMLFSAVSSQFQAI